MTVHPIIVVAAALALSACSKNESANDVQANTPVPETMGNQATSNDMMANGLCEGAGCNGDMNAMMGNRATMSGMPANSNAAVDEHVVYHDNGVVENQ